MAVSRRLVPLKDELRQELKNHTRNKDSARKEFLLRFVLEEDVRSILDRSRLRILCLEIFRKSGLLPGTSYISGDDVRKVDGFINRELEGGRGQHKYLLTLATILYACGLDALTAFKAWLDNEGTWPRIPCSCCNLPLSNSEASTTFGEVDGPKFYRSQNVFRPLVIDIGKDNCLSLKGSDSGRPMPFLDEPIRIGGGSAGEVFKVRIAKRHFKWSTSQQGSPSHVHDEELELAVKLFQGPESSSTSEYSAAHRYKLEYRNLVNLRRRPIKHENIMLFIRSVIEEGPDLPRQMLFFPLAVCNLDDFLWERRPKWHNNESDVFVKGPMFPQGPTSLTVQQQAEIMVEAVDLVGGLASLHETSNLYSPIIHCDIKPSNILLQQVPNDDAKRPRFRWMLTDFDQAAAAEPFEDVAPALPDRHQSVPVHVHGIFQPPETDGETPKADISSDGWSMGCVLLYVLCFLEDRKEGIQALEHRLKIWRVNEDTDQICGQLSRFYLKPGEHWDEAYTSRPSSQGPHPHREDLTVATELLLHPAVLDRLDMLSSPRSTGGANGHLDTETASVIIGEVAEYLLTNVLIVGREDRKDAYKSTGRLLSCVTHAYNRLLKLANKMEAREIGIRDVPIPTPAPSDTVDHSEACRVIKDRNLARIKTLCDENSPDDPNKPCPKCRMSPLWSLIEDEDDECRNETLRTLLLLPGILVNETRLKCGYTPLERLCKLKDRRGIKVLVETAGSRLVLGADFKEEYYVQAPSTIKHALRPILKRRLSSLK